MAGENDYVVNTLPSICDQLTIFYFQETNQTVCVKYTIISCLGFSWRYFLVAVWVLFILGGSAEQENLLPYYVIKFLQFIHSYVRYVGIQYHIGAFNFILPLITEFH